MPDMGLDETGVPPIAEPARYRFTVTERPALSLAAQIGPGYLHAAGGRHLEPWRLWGLALEVDVRADDPASVRAIADAVLDRLTGLAWRRLAQVAKVEATIRRGDDPPRLAVRIYEITEA